MIWAGDGIRVTILVRNKLRRIRIRPCNDTNTLKSLLHSQFLPKYTKYVSFSTFFLSRFTSNNAHAFKINWILTHRPEVQVFESRWKREFKFSSKNISKLPKMTKKNRLERKSIFQQMLTEQLNFDGNVHFWQNHTILPKNWKSILCLIYFSTFSMKIYGIYESNWFIYVRHRSVGIRGSNNSFWKVLFLCLFWKCIFCDSVVLFWYKLETKGEFSYSIVSIMTIEMETHAFDV